jgi:parallel beta-helix repeat protein
MKNATLLRTLTIVLLGTTADTTFPAAGPGPLNPAGPPAVGLFKTLDQVEPRTPIFSLPFTINESGSYYLTGNLTGAPGANGINISASDVTLDLRGFALIGSGGGSGDGINVFVMVTNVAVRNGTVRGWGARGVDADTAFNSQLIDIRASQNGTDGMSLGPGGILMGCTARANGQDGIETLGICTVSGCSSTLNAGDGITVGPGSTITGCSASGNSDDGILGGAGSAIRGNTVFTNVGDGIEVNTDCQVVDNTCDGNGVGAASSAGIHATGAANRIERNNLADNDRGLDIDSSGNVVSDNSVRGNTDNYDIAAGNQLRLLLSQIPETIDRPATVTLAGSLTGVAGQNGITITTNDVTIDLAGHALIGVAGSLDGISVSGNRTNIAIRNGAIRSWGSDGLQASTAYNGQFTDLRVSGNGANGMQTGNGGVIKCCSSRGNGADGITTVTGCTVSDCTASENRSDGIVASTGSTVSGCSAYNNSFVGIVASEGSTVVNCTAYSNTNGISASSGSTVNGCTASVNSTNGIIVAFGSTVTGCTARGNRTGINVGDDCRVVNNSCDNNSGTGSAGILATGSDNRLDGNSLTDNGDGIRANPATGNLIVRNTASGNGTAYDIAAGNTVGPIVGAVSPIASTSPWANFSF